MSKKQIQALAIFMVALIVVIPIYSADAMARFLSADSYGVDKIRGYARKQDNIIINATASVAGDANITQNQVKVGDRDFDNCGLLNDVQKTFICTYSSISDNIVGTFQYNLRLFDDLGNLDDQRNILLVVDSEAPIIQAFTASKNYVKPGDRIAFSYNIKDTACSLSGCSGKCTGVKDAKILVSDQQVANKTINDNSCSPVQGEIEWNASGAGITTACIKASDMFSGESLLNCVNITIDATPPLISDFAVTKNNEPLNFVNGPTQAIVSAMITDDISFDVNSAKADLSKLNPNLRTLVSGSCSRENSRYLCIWPITVDINQDATAEAVINASDSAGNSIAVNFPFTIRFDKISPSIISLSSEITKDGQNYLGVEKPVTIKAVFEEAGAGFYFNKTYLNLNSLNPVYPSSGTRTNGCELLAEGWVCYWYNVTASGTSRTASINFLSTEDDVGNPPAGNLSWTFFVDADKPKIINSSLSCTREKGENTSYCQEGDTILLNYYVADELPVNAYGNFSEFFSVMQNETAGCEAVEDATLCKWTIPAVEPSGKVNRTFRLTFEDLAGNSRIENPSMLVLQVSNDTNPNFWKIDSRKIISTPSVVDRQTASLIPQRVYFSIPLETNFDDIEVLSLEFGNCTNIPNSTVDSAAYLSKKPEIFNNIGRDPRNPYILLTLSREQFKIDQLDFACSLKIISRVKTKVTQPEVKNFNVSISFYNLPLGEISKSVQDEIERAKNDPIVQNKLVGSMQNIINFAEKICNVMYSIQTALNTFAKLKQAFELFKLLKNPITDATINKYNDFLKGAYRGNTNFLDKFTKYCAYISCDKKILWGNAYDKFIEDSKKNLEFAKKLHFNCVQSVNQKTKETGILTQFQKQYAYSTENCGATIWPQSPKESIVLSAAAACIPGIVYNLQKQRQIKCAYIDCLKNGVQNGMPIEACKKQQEYATCRYVTGQVFQLIPYANFFNTIANQVRTIISNPIGLIFAVKKYQCTQGIDQSVLKETLSLCIITETVTELGKIANLINSFRDVSNWDINRDYCEEALK